MKFYKERLLGILACIFLPTISIFANAEDSLRVLVNKARQSNASFQEVSQFYQQLKSDYPNTKESAIGSAFYIWYLLETPKKSEISDIENIYNTLKSSENSQWYVAFARLGLINAYCQIDRIADAKSLAQQGISVIDWPQVRTSYRADLEFLKRCCGNTAVLNTDAWKNAMEAINNQ